MLSESASLILSSGSTINPPTINAQRTFVTFNNIDLKNVMGEMWDKYDTFCVKVASWNNGRQAIVTGSGSTFNVVSYNLRGLEWINVIYETTNSSVNAQWVPIMNSYLFGTTIVQNFSNTGQSFNFKKGSRLVNLDVAININGLSDIGNIAAGNTYNDFSFQLIFEPVIPGKMNECAFFGFNSANILTNINRVVSADRKEYYYPAFDIRNLCKDFWEKHDDFEIQMAQVLYTGIGTIVFDNRQILIQMNGLNFVNNATKQTNTVDRLKLSSENAIIGALIASSNASAHFGQNDYTPAPVQFKKTEDNIPLTITFKNYNNTTVAEVGTLTGVNPRIAIGFFIRPIYNVEKATLCINPYGLTTTETNLGVRDADYFTFTLKNIDMRQVCRSMWLKYNKFNIFLTSFTTAAIASDASNNALLLQMEGLSFINQTALLTTTDTYNAKQVATLGMIFTSTGTNLPFANSCGSCLATTFYKTQDFVDLKLTATPYSAVTPGAMNPLRAVFTFTILGVPEDEDQAKEFTQNRVKS